ncbi:flagellar hook-length control protein FliK [Legionella clemsonensis]|uniref:Flagellar hook-length control protein n=1 Tax=Legionella clemsonensis TaxID=1867846 RepID=A0A222P2I9_9GAMM|nr:flagellar hook-length control protein FliK [Legionella clemsonensis]ASQ46068.1 Flagellar hook-length control protein [Legionella clemsonensis]
MFDLIQLISMQLAGAGKSASLQLEDKVLQPAQDEIAFITLMAELLAESTPTDSNEKVSFTLQAIPLTSDETDETQPIEPEIIATNVSELMQIDDPDEAQKILQIESTREEKDSRDPADDLLLLAWFNASIFESPNREVPKVGEVRQSKEGSTLEPEMLNNVIVSNNLLNSKEIEASPAAITTSPLPGAQLKPDQGKKLLPQELPDAEMRILATGITIADNPPDKETASLKRGDEVALFSNDAEEADFKTNKNGFADITDIKLPISNRITQPPSMETSAFSAMQTVPSKNLEVPFNATVSPKVLHLTQTVSSPEWGENFTQQIMWLGQQKIKTAIIKLNPQELGPLEVNLKLIKDTASVNITTHTVQVRELIEQTLPRLREMMSEQGVNLSQVNIDAHNHQRSPSPQKSESITYEQENGEETILLTPLPRPKNKGIVDYFA